MEIELNEQERDLVRYISRRNWSVYAVGGVVRDTLLGKNRGDLDIVVEAPQFRELVQHLKHRYVVLRDGIPYKTAKVVLDHDPKLVVDVTVPRGEIYQGPADDPVEYEVGEISRDLSRRDFTINSMALGLNGGQQNLLDAFGGEKDLRNGIIKFVGNPDKRIEEDPTQDH
jgi:tRNA nucleotidyltransferase/poly(A) polymerase